jgi:protein-disulfide isomerase
MSIGRRDVLGVLAAAVAGLGAAAARAQGDPWFPITGDDGKLVANMRLPVELTSEIETLPGVVWTGSATPGVTLIEFFDYNCPYCRKAAPDIHALVRDTPDLRVGLVNNPILSPRSADAAKVELALLKLNGPSATYEFHRRLFERRGTIDGPKALEVVAAVGAPRAELERAAAGEEVRAALDEQMRLAASLGFSATPSFMIAGAGVFGYPGSEALKQMLASVNQCDQIAC